MTGPSTYSVALGGDAILNTRVSACADHRVTALVDLIRTASVGYAHLEVPLHDFDRADAYPAVEGALSWMSAPTWVADELRWCGIGLVSTASNHALDYSYGGLASTLDALDGSGIAHAGTGLDLGSARSPAFVDTASARVALVSATSSFPMFARAGAARIDGIGRPGVNTLRHHHVVDPATADSIIAMAARLGLWVTELGDEFAVSPAGMFNSMRRFVVDRADPGVTTVCDEDDLAANLASVRYAAAVADFVIVHLHTHDWDSRDGRLSSSPEYVEQYAREAAAAGASVVIAQGSHAPMRGVEIIDGVPVLYDPGPLFRLGRRDRQPQDFYVRWGSTPAARAVGAGPLDAFAARDGYFGGNGSLSRSPREGISHHPGAVLPICQVDAVTHRVTSVHLHPLRWLASPRAHVGFPGLLDGDEAAAVVSAISTLSERYGTRITTGDGPASIRIAQDRVDQDRIDHNRTDHEIVDRTPR